MALSVHRDFGASADVSVAVNAPSQPTERRTCRLHSVLNFRVYCIICTEGTCCRDYLQARRYIFQSCTVELVLVQNLGLRRVDRDADLAIRAVEGVQSRLEVYLT